MDHSNPGNERRRAERIGYEAIVMVAEFDGQNLPLPDQFRAVETRDLSPMGISFLDSRSPTSDLIVLRLGGSKLDPIYVTARVAHCNEGFWERKRQFMVGCELTGRLKST